MPTLITYFVRIHCRWVKVTTGLAEWARLPHVTASAAAGCKASAALLAGLAAATMLPAPPPEPAPPAPVAAVPAMPPPATDMPPDTALDFSIATGPWADLPADFAFAADSFAAAYGAQDTADCCRSWFAEPPAPAGWSRSITPTVQAPFAYAGTVPTNAAPMPDSCCDMPITQPDSPSPPDITAQPPPAITALDEPPAWAVFAASLVAIRVIRRKRPAAPPLKPQRARTPRSAPPTARRPPETPPACR